MGKKKIQRTVQGDIAKDIIKIRLQMWGLKNLCPLCEIEEDTTEHVLRCKRYTDRNPRNIKNNTEEEWEEVVQIYRENKRKREERREKV